MLAPSKECSRKALVDSKICRIGLSDLRVTPHDKEIEV
jgi:hypothetical protein